MYANVFAALTDIRLHSGRHVHSVKSTVTLALQAQLHARRGENNEAAHYYRQSLQRSEEQGIAGSLDVEAVEFIAQVRFI